MNEAKIEASLVADKIVCRLAADISDRRGLKHEWAAIDSGVMAYELRPAWIKIIMEEMAKAGDRQPEANPNAGNIAGSSSATLLERIIERMDNMRTEITRRDPALKDEYMRGAKYAAGMCIGIVREETLRAKLRSNNH